MAQENKNNPSLDNFEFHGDSFGTIRGLLRTRLESSATVFQSRLTEEQVLQYTNEYIEKYGRLFDPYRFMDGFMELEPDKE